MVVKTEPVKEPASTTAGTPAETFRVPSQSMAPGLTVGDEVTVRAYGSTAPKVGDVVVFHPPAGAERNECGTAPPPGSACPESTPERSATLFIKRVVAVAGDRLAIRRGRVYVNGTERDPWKIAPDAVCGICNLPVSIRVPVGSVYVLGDNRGESADSREWGPVRVGWIVGKVETP